MRHLLGRIGDGLALCAQTVAGLFLLVMVAIVAIGVAARYLLGSAPAWSEELPRLLLIWSALLGAVVAERNASHLTAGLFPLLVKRPALRRANTLARGLVSVAVYALLAIAFLHFTGRTIRNTLPALQVSVGYIYAAGVVAFALMAVVGSIGLLTSRADS